MRAALPMSELSCDAIRSTYFASPDASFGGANREFVSSGLEKDLRSEPATKSLELGRSAQIAFASDREGLTLAKCFRPKLTRSI